MENVITLGKVIGLLLLCPPSSLFFFFENSKNKNNELARPVLGNIFLVGRAKREPPLNHLGLDFVYYMYIRTYVFDTHARVSDLR